MRNAESERRKLARRLAVAALIVLTVLPGLAQSEATDASADAGEPAETISRGEVVSLFTGLSIDADETVLGGVVCIGCDGVVSGEVRGDLVAVGGSLVIDAPVRGDLVLFAASAEITPATEVGGDFVSVVSDVDGAAGSVGGERVDVAPTGGLPSGWGSFSAVVGLIGWIVAGRVLVRLLLTILTAALAPRRMDTIARRVGDLYGMALLVGFAIGVVYLVVVALLVVSVVGLPLVPFLWAAMWFVRLVGRTGLFVVFGRRLGGIVGFDLSVLGAAVVGFLPYAILLVLPMFFGVAGLFVGCTISLLFKVLVDWPSVGLAVLTRLGDERNRAPAA